MNYLNKTFLPAKQSIKSAVIGLCLVALPFISYADGPNGTQERLQYPMVESADIVKEPTGPRGLGATNSRLQYEKLPCRRGSGPSGRQGCLKYEQGGEPTGPRGPGHTQHRLQYEAQAEPHSGNGQRITSFAFLDEDGHCVVLSEDNSVADCTEEQALMLMDLKEGLSPHISDGNCIVLSEDNSVANCTEEQAYSFSRFLERREDFNSKRRESYAIGIGGAALIVASGLTLATGSPVAVALAPVALTWGAVATLYSTWTWPGKEPLPNTNPFRGADLQFDH